MTRVISTWTNLGPKVSKFTRDDVLLNMQPGLGSTKIMSYQIITNYFDTTWYGKVSHLDISKCRTSGEKVRIRILLGSESLALSISALNTELALAPDLSG